MYLKRIAAGVGALVLSSAVLAGCGEGDESASAGSSASSSSSSSDLALSAEDFTAMAKAAQEAGSSHLEMTVTGGGLTITAEGDQRIGEVAADGAMAMTMSMQGMTLDMRMLDQTMYISMDAITGDKFVEIDLTDGSDPLAAQFGSLLDTGDVTKQLEQFGEILQDVEDTGKTETVDGVEAKIYKITVDGKKAVEASGTEVDPSMIPDSVTYDFYIGSDNLVRRMTMDLMGQSMQMDFTDWGKDVTIEKPSADQISDIDLASMLSGAAG